VLAARSKSKTRSSGREVEKKQKLDPDQATAAGEPSWTKDEQRRLPSVEEVRLSEAARPAAVGSPFAEHVNSQQRPTACHGVSNSRTLLAKV
jgi:hypothetical protein